MKKILAALLIAFSIFTMSGCSKNDTIYSPITESPIEDIVIEEKEYEYKEGSYSSASSDALINLTDKIITNGNNNVAFEDDNIIITKAGTYVFIGKATGSIIINASKDDEVDIVLNGVDLKALKNSPFMSNSSDKTRIILADESVNILTDSSEYENVEANACIYSKDDLIIKGNGTIVCNANYNNGIGTKDDLKIKSGTIIVSAVNNALKGNDSVTIEDGVIKLTSKSDGIKSDNETDSTKGYVSILGGNTTIISGNDGIDAYSNVTIEAGTLEIKTGDGSKNSYSSSESMKGIKAVKNIEIKGGDILIDSIDDSIHTNDTIVIKGGTIKVSSGDDGIHADNTLSISEGNIVVLKSYEGLEATIININGGSIDVVSSDDGINACGGNDTNNQNQRPGAWNPISSGNGLISINGGYVYVNASGDGLDANGRIEMRDGFVIVNGPVDNGNGALDYDQTFNIYGGTIIAAGSSGMAQGSSSTSTSYGILVNFSETVKEGTIIEFNNGSEIIAFAPAKNITSIFVSSPNLSSGDKVDIYIGGSYSLDPINGYFSGGTYTKGTLYKTLTITGIITTDGASQMRPGRP